MITVGFTQDSTSYNRKDWKHWIDVDRDCQNTRQEVLIEESVIPVTFDSRGCRVLSGRWICPFTGRVFTDPKYLDIDHMVALKEAHDSGGWTWSKEKKQIYANDLNESTHLVAVYKGANRSKGSRSPEQWMPPNKYYGCLYLFDWVKVKTIWELSMTKEESEFIDSYLESYCKED